MKKQLQLKMSSIFIVLLALSSYAQNIGDQFIDNDIEYEITAISPTEIEVVGYVGIATELTIPQTAKYQSTDYTVIAIGYYAFRQKGLTSVVIPYGVESIERAAFANNYLSEVIIPNSVTSIASHAFASNQLTNITIPDGVTAIGDVAFYNNQLTSVTIPNSVTSIGRTAFAYNDLTEVTIPNSVTSIGNYAFWNNQLTEVTIPNHVTSIGTSAFAANPNLATVVTKAAVPPSLHADTFQNPDRNQIDLIVPMGKRQVYLNNGWMGFKSITETAVLPVHVAQSFSAKTPDVAPAYVHKGNEHDNITVYPNPAKDNIYIKLPGDAALQQVNIYNTLGVRIDSVNDLPIDISHLHRGIYMLEIKTKTGEKVVKRIMIK